MVDRRMGTVVAAVTTERGVIVDRAASQPSTGSAANSRSAIQVETQLDKTNHPTRGPREDTKSPSVWKASGRRAFRRTSVRDWSRLAGTMPRLEAEGRCLSSLRRARYVA